MEEKSIMSKSEMLELNDDVFDDKEIGAVRIEDVPEDQLED
jgi:hypothetical protein